MNTTAANKSINKPAYKAYIEKGLSYEQYKRNMAGDLALNIDEKVTAYITLNQRRMYRVEKSHVPSPEIVLQAKNLKQKIYWVVLTEHWCGDASQTLPAFNSIAGLSEGKIEMKLVCRDQNEELMNAQLTNGTRSIPKLIQLDDEFNVTGVWGPRPTQAQKMVRELKSNPATAANYANELHLWYAKDKQESLAKEIAQLLMTADLLSSACLS